MPGTGHQASIGKPSRCAQCKRRISRIALQARINQRQSLPLLQTRDGLYPRFMLEQTIEFHPQTG